MTGSISNGATRPYQPEEQFNVEHVALQQEKELPFSSYQKAESQNKDILKRGKLYRL